MSDHVTLVEVEDRLRRTLARRAGDVPPAGDNPFPLLSPDPDPALVAAPTSGPRRRRVLVAAAVAAVCVAGAAAVGVALSGGDETTEIGPAQEGPTSTDTTAATGPTTTDTTAPAGPTSTVAADQWDPDAEDASNPVQTDPGRGPSLVAGFEQPGVPANQDIWLYATFYPSPGMAATVAPGDTREAVAGAEVPADLDTAGDYPAITVWLRYNDGVLGLHSGMISHDEMVAMAQTVHRTPGTREFTWTAPPGWERSD